MFLDFGLAYAVEVPTTATLVTEIALAHQKQKVWERTQENCKQKAEGLISNCTKPDRMARPAVFVLN